MRIAKGSPVLVRGYSTGVQRSFYFSATEPMGDAIRNHITNWEINDGILEGSLGQIARPLPQRDDALSNAVRTSGPGFLANEHDNLRFVATAMRNLVADGEFTPLGTGLITKVHADAIGRLGFGLLGESKQPFAIWLENMPSLNTR